MKNYKVKLILKDCTIIELEGAYTYVYEIFNRVTTELILRNRTENEILKMTINL